MSKKSEKLMKSARAQLAILEPFFSTLLFKYPMKEADYIPTACVDPKGQIYFNPDFVETLTVYELQFLLCHEVLHIVYTHALRRGERNMRVWNYACDMVINETLISLNIGRAMKGCLRYNGAENMTAEQVYEKLINEHGGQPWGSSGDNEELTDIVGDGDANAPEEENDPLSTARKKLGQKLSDSERRRVSAETKMNTSEAVTLAKMGSRSQGSARAGFFRKMEELIMGDPYPWHRLLANYMTKFVSQGQSWKRPNRRFSDVYLPTTDRQPSMGAMVIGIDTSGSIGEKELSVFGAHINQIMETCRPESVTVLWCDSYIAGVDEYTCDDLPIEFKPKGGGGTDMREITRWCNENAPDADVCVIFTDGYTPYPDEGEEGVSTVWVITETMEPPEYLTYIKFSLED